MSVVLPIHPSGILSMSRPSPDLIEPGTRRIETSNLGRLAPAIDSKTGIVRRVDLLRNSWIDPDVFCAVAQDASVAPLVGNSFDNRGAAAALTPARAAVRATGECIERYCSAFQFPAQMLQASTSELKKLDKSFCSTELFYPFRPEQYQEAGFMFQPLTPDAKIRWVHAINFHTRENVLVPASCVFLPYLFESEPITHAPISTGLAAGVSITDCIEKGAAEIIERDCLMINWKTRRTVPGIDVKTCFRVDPDIDRLLSSTSRLPGSWHVHLLTLDVEVPVFSAAFINDSGLPMTSFGISAGKDVKSALRGAMEEALLSRFLLNRASQVAEADNKSENTFRTLRDHLFGHAVSPSLKENFFQIFDPLPSIPFSEVITRFRSSHTVVEAAKEAGLEVLYYDVTTPDVASLGVSSIRVLIPTAEPLDPDHEAQHLGGVRLQSANGGSSVFYAAPHPFP